MRRHEHGPEPPFCGATRDARDARGPGPSRRNPNRHRKRRRRRGSNPRRWRRRARRFTRHRHRDATRAARRVGDSRRRRALVIRRRHRRRRATFAPARAVRVARGELPPRRRALGVVEPEKTRLARPRRPRLTTKGVFRRRVLVRLVRHTLLRTGHHQHRARVHAHQHHVGVHRRV